jgi:hypothetical protein
VRSGGPIGVVKLLRARGECLGVIRRSGVEGCDKSRGAAQRASSLEYPSSVVLADQLRPAPPIDSIPTILRGSRCDLFSVLYQYFRQRFMSSNSFFSSPRAVTHLISPIAPYRNRFVSTESGCIHEAPPPSRTDIGTRTTSLKNCVSEGREHSPCFSGFTNYPRSRTSSCNFEVCYDSSASHSTVLIQCKALKAIIPAKYMWAQTQWVLSS